MIKPVPEAQLQAYVLGLAREAFSHLPPDNFRVEKWIKLRIGRGTHEEDGGKYWEADGRADLVVYYGDRALAVFELKREDHRLTLDDVDQARSYALVMLEQPPIVIVSNGADTWVRQAIDGKPLDSAIEGADIIEKIFESIGNLAAANNSWAIETLMGPEAKVWIEAVRRRTDELIERLTGEAHDTRKPFGRALLFQRSSTTEILRLLEAGAAAVVVEGPPLVGKSNVLRDLALRCRTSPRWAVLMVNAGTRGPGLFQRLANILGDALEWKLSADDVRTWLRRMSRSSRQPSLVLAVDGVRSGSDVASDIEELAEIGFGDGLRIVVATDRSDDVLRDDSGRGETALAAIAEVVEVGPFNSREFHQVREASARNRVLFYGGAELAQEYRTGWILRSVLANGTTPENEDIAAVIPATMGLKIIQVARRRLESLGEVARLHKLVARDALADQNDPVADLALAQTSAFVISRDALSAAGEAAAVKLQEQGWVSFHRHRTGQDLVVFRAPEFMMSELTTELAAILDDLVDTNMEEAVAQLMWQSDRFFLGDMIGAYALIDLAAKRGTIPIGLIEPLMNDPPEPESMAGKLIGIPTQSGEIVNLRFDQNGGVAKADAQGNPLEPFIPLDEDDSCPVMHGNMTSWLLLSQLAMVRAAFGATGGERLDTEIILHVGQCKTPLMRGGVDPRLPHATQNFGSSGSVLALEHALAEPITAALHKLVAEEWRDLDPFFARVAEADSLLLSVRVHNVLVTLQNSADEGLGDFVQTKLRDLIHPLVRAQLPTPPSQDPLTA